MGFINWQFRKDGGATVNMGTDSEDENKVFSVSEESGSWWVAKYAYIKNGRAVEPIRIGSYKSHKGESGKSKATSACEEYNRRLGDKN